MSESTPSQTVGPFLAIVLPWPDGASVVFAIRTLKPGALPTPDGEVEAPHLDVTVFARGLLRHLVTRLYFPDEPQANDADPVLRSLDAADRDALTAVPDGMDGLRFDIRLQGDGETPFFTV